MTTDELYMQRCLQLARHGWRTAPPNPMVGALIVADGRIIGEGFHVRCGEGHAEVNAFAAVQPADEPLLTQATLYVSLEPCSHFGKTPPCADLIIRKGIRRCVVGCIDPFDKVKGRGIDKLRQAGIDVEVGVLENECRALNKHFFTFHQQHRPFVTLKWAQTADGFIGRKDQTPDNPLTISNPLTRMLCHKRRAEHQAIMVGSHTMQTDAPRLNVRLWSGDNPIPLVLTRANGPLPDQLRRLWTQGVQTLLVEGGRETLQSFIDEGLWDEAYVETGTRPLDGSDGVPAPRLHGAQLVGVQMVGGHKMERLAPAPRKTTVHH